MTNPLTLLRRSVATAAYMGEVTTREGAPLMPLEERASELRDRLPAFAAVLPSAPGAPYGHSTAMTDAYNPETAEDVTIPAAPEVYVVDDAIDYPESDAYETPTHVTSEVVDYAPVTDAAAGDAAAVPALPMPPAPPATPEPTPAAEVAPLEVPGMQAPFVPPTPGALPGLPSMPEGWSPNQQPEPAPVAAAPVEEVVEPEPAVESQFSYVTGLNVLNEVNGLDI